MYRSYEVVLISKEFNLARNKHLVHKIRKKDSKEVLNRLWQILILKSGNDVVSRIIIDNKTKATLAQKSSFHIEEDSRIRKAHADGIVFKQK